MKYKWLKGLWKGARTTGIALGCYALASYQNWMPQEYLTPAGILVLEFLRNRLFGEHNKSVFSSKSPD